jgi:pyridoxal phosphate enzyme (YggS family)
MHIEDRIQEIRQRIATAAEQCGRSLDDVSLIAVTKTHPAEMIDQALAAGIRQIGENKIQEAEQKLPLLTQPYDEFHFIGHLQSNKIKKLMPLKPALIHSIDSFSTAQKLDAWCSEHNHHQDILLQVNTSAEESKWGVEPAALPELCAQVATLPHLHIQGLMTIGIFSDDETAVRTCFKLLRSLRDELPNTAPANVSMHHLSMGMTNDFEIAIQEGATLVRIGSAIFGSRSYT